MTNPPEPTTDNTGESPKSTESAGDAAPSPLLELRDQLPEVIQSDEALAQYCRLIRAGSGPVAIDAERASGYRYSQRAYLIQLRREGAGTALIDPIAVSDLSLLDEAMADTEWILHAATQDLACLAEVGLRPRTLFDTELAGRLLGYPRVGLASLVEGMLGQHLRKEHSAADWSTRPLPESWLEYAALDVEALIELRAVMFTELEASGKQDWARQEFDHLLDFTPTVREEPWRRTSHMHRVRSRRGLAAVRSLWIARDELAREGDVTPGRILPDSAIVAAASAMPTSRGSLLSTQGFHGRGAARHSRIWLAALREAADLPESELPPRNIRGDGPPPPRAWADRDAKAARRLHLAREAMTELSERVNIPTENILTPDYLRRVLWEPPAPRTIELLEPAVSAALSGLSARTWQVELTAPLLAQAIIAGEEPAPDPASDPGPSAEPTPGLVSDQPELPSEG